MAIYIFLTAVGYSTALPWLTRIKIAVGAAKGLAFLHGEDQPVIYRDFKTSNILLDSVTSCPISNSLFNHVIFMLNFPFPPSNTVKIGIFTRTILLSFRILDWPRMDQKEMTHMSQHV